jgi:hypothetical protein
MAHDVFICHSSTDKTIADAVCATLEAHKIRCWISPRDVVPGTDYASSIIDAITSSGLMVLVFSSHSNSSGHVGREIERAVSHGIPILPFRVEAVDPSPALEYYISVAHWLDAFTPPLEQHLEHLAGTVRMLLDRAAGAPPPVAVPPALAAESGAVLAPAAPTVAAAPRPPAVDARGWAPPVGPPSGPAGHPGPLPAAAPGWGEPPPSAAPPARSLPPEPPFWRRGWGIAGIVLGVLMLIGMIGALVGEDPETTAGPGWTVSPGESTDTGGTDTTPSTVPSGSGWGAAPVDAVDRFAFTETMSFTGAGEELAMTVEGSFVAPASQDCTMTVTSSGFTVAQRLVVTGAGTWFDSGAGLVPTPRDDELVASLEAVCPSSSVFWADLTGLPQGEGPVEDVNGTPSMRLDLGDAAFLGGFIPAGLTLDRASVWVAETEHWISGLDFQITGDAVAFRDAFGFPPAGVDGEFVETVRFTVRSVGDPAVTVAAPGS